MKAIEIFGPRASGKSTLSAALVELNGMHSISLGREGRKQIALGTPVGLEMEKHMQEKTKFPDGFFQNFMLQILRDAKKNRDARKKGIIIDGFPRRSEEAKEFIEIINILKIDFHTAIELMVSIDVLIKRSEDRGWCKQCDFQGSINEHKNICPKCNIEMSKRPDDTADEIIRMNNLYYQNNSIIKATLVEGTHCEWKTVESNTDFKIIVKNILL